MCATCTRRRSGGLAPGRGRFGFVGLHIDGSVEGWQERAAPCRETGTAAAGSTAPRASGLQAGTAETIGAPASDVAALGAARRGTPEYAASIRKALVASSGDPKRAAALACGYAIRPAIATGATVATAPDSARADNDEAGSAATSVAAAGTVACEPTDAS